MLDRRALAVASTLLLAGCGAPTVDDQVGLTKLACLTKGGELFPDVKNAFHAFDAGENDLMANENAAESLIPGEAFRFVSTGKFVYDIPKGSADGIAPLTCTGDFNRRTIETINHNGMDKRPATGEVWSI